MGGIGGDGKKRLKKYKGEVEKARRGGGRKGGGCVGGGEEECWVGGG